MHTLAGEQRTIVYCNYFFFRAKVSASRAAVIYITKAYCLRTNTFYTLLLFGAHPLDFSASGRLRIEQNTNIYIIEVIAEVEQVFQV